MMTGKRKTSSQPKRKEQSTSKQKKKFIWWKFLLKVSAAGILFLALLFFSVYIGLLGKMPSTEELNRIRTPLATEVFSIDGKLLGRFYIENRSNVRYDEISPNVVNALIATEDARFYEHRGIDEIALLRVFFKSILMQDRSQGGGSTLSQQIAKNLYPRPELGWFTIPVSKIREGIIAYRLEKIYSKEDIITLYLNTVPFGENIFGIEVASERFFSKSPKDLTVPEAAVLVGILKANNLFNPRLHPDRSLQRRNVVIGQMVKQGHLTEEEARKHKEAPLGLKYNLITYNQGPAPYLLEHLRPTLAEWCKNHTKPNGEPYNLYSDGLRVYTTLDYNLQRYATQSVSEHMKQLQQIFDTHWKDREPWRKDNLVVERAMKRTSRYKTGQKAGKTDEQMKEEFSQSIETTLFSWDGLKAVQTTPLDSLKHYMKMLNAGFMAIEPVSGQVKAWVGGIDFRFFKYDYVKAPRQTGSTFKPVIYLSALENGLSPLDYFPNEKKTYSEHQNWSPSNSDGVYGGYYSMKGALTKSVNTISAELITLTGIGNAIETARKLGVKSDLPEYPSLALGTASLSLREMLTTYSAIINGGIPIEPHILVRIENNEGKVLEEFEEPLFEESSIDPENCRLIIDMLRNVIDAGTGRAIRNTYKITGDFAGKTGTTQNHADGWFIGFTPSLVAGCWVGADDPAIHFRTLAYGQGAYMALPIVGKFYNKMYADPKFAYMKIQQFEKPESDILLAMNNMEPWVENIRPSFTFTEISPKTDDAISSTKKEKLKERKESEKEDKEPVWKLIKNIFKKKDK